MKISSGTLVLGIFAVLFGLVGAYAAKQYLAEVPPVEKPPAPEPEVPKVTVPMASVDLPAGRTVTNGDLVVTQMTREQLRERKLPPGFMGDGTQIIGRTLKCDVGKFKPFVPDDLYPEGTAPSVAEKLEPGFRAVTIALENSEAEMALLSPSSIVDVVFRTFPDSQAGRPATTVTLLEKVEILAIGEQTFPGGRANFNSSQSRQAPSVTLACTPDQASALKVVQDRGSLSLVMRSPEDDMLVGHSPPRTLESLLELPENEPAVTTEIYRRGQLTTAVFEKGRQVVVTESFGGLPIAADPPRPTTRPISYSSSASRIAASATSSSTAAAEPGCGCGK